MLAEVKFAVVTRVKILRLRMDPSTGLNICDVMYFENVALTGTCMCCIDVTASTGVCLFLRFDIPLCFRLKIT